MGSGMFLLPQAWEKSPKKVEQKEEKNQARQDGGRKERGITNEKVISRGKGKIISRERGERALRSSEGKGRKIVC